MRKKGKLKGVVKWGPCACRAKRYVGMCINITLWYMHVPLNRPYRYVHVPKQTKYGTCTYF